MTETPSALLTPSTADDHRDPAGGASRASELQIQNWSELAAHLEATGKREAYRKFLFGLGVDPDAPEVRGLGDRPALLFAEQPGCWFTARDVVRARLLERLIDRGGFDAELSGVRTLAHDRFTADGDKSVFLDFRLHPRLGPARLVGSQFIKKYDHRTYASLNISSSTLQRIKAIWDYSLQMIEAASISPQRFEQVVRGIFDASPVKGARDVLPEGHDSASLLAIGEDLAHCRLEPAFQALWPARSALHRDIAWPAYWDAVNSEFLGMGIESLSTLLGRFLLAVQDPVKLARRMHEEGDGAPDEPVSVAGIVSDDDVFRTVYFDPVHEHFFLTRRDGSLRVLAWDEIRAAATDGRGARPSGVLEYLLLAAFGFYLLVDCGDSVQPFHEAACAAHRRATGLGFPWVTFSVRGPLAEDGNSFIDVFRPGFVELAVNVIGDFLDH